MIIDQSIFQLNCFLCQCFYKFSANEYRASTCEPVVGVYANSSVSTRVRHAFVSVQHRRQRLQTLVQTTNLELGWDLKWMKYRELIDEMGSKWRKRIKVGRKMNPREEDIL